MGLLIDSAPCCVARQRSGQRKARLIAVPLSVVALLLIAPLLTRGNATRTVALPDDICVMAPPQAYDPASARAMLVARAIPDDARCPVCGMYPARAGMGSAVDL